MQKWEKDGIAERTPDNNPSKKEFFDKLVNLEKKYSEQAVEESFILRKEIKELDEKSKALIAENTRLRETIKFLAKTISEL